MERSNDFHGLSSSILSPCGQKAMGVMVIAGQVQSTPLRLSLLLHFFLFQLYLSLSSHLYLLWSTLLCCSVLLHFVHLIFLVSLSSHSVCIYGNAELCFFFAGDVRVVVFT